MKKKIIESELISDDGKLIFKVGGKVVKYKMLNYKLQPDSNKTKCDVVVDDNEYTDVNFIDMRTERFKLSNDELQDLSDRDKELFLMSVPAKIKKGNL